MHLNKDDINILENLAHFSKEILSKDNHNRINEITKMIIEKTFNTNQSKDNYPYKAGLWGKYGKKIETLSYYFGEKINLLHNGEKTCVTPIHFRYGRGKIYLFAFDEKDIENKLYSLDDISEISSARGHSFKINFAKSTIFKLTGRVAKGYTSPYEKEIIEYKEDGSDKTVFEPDVLIVCDKDKIKGLKTINGAPDFVVEVLSNSNRKYEMYDKLHKYRTCGVREYWVVDYDHNKIIKHYFENDGEIMIYSMEDKVPVDIYGGKLEIDFKEIKEYIDGIIN